LNIVQIKETCLYFRDLEVPRKFYGELLGLPVVNYLKDKHIFFRAGSSVLLCFNPADSSAKESPPPHYGEGRYHFAFEVKANEYETHKSEIKAKGITILDEVKWPTGQESFYFEDPGGNVLEIVPEGIWTT
jgi:catechol 2,3-dioxygenase-like lactoylglutathione lyase family enzyme